MARTSSRGKADVLHCSARRFRESDRAGDGRNLAGWVKAFGGLPTITVGSIGLDIDVMPTFVEGKDPSPRIGEAIADLERRLAAGEFDLVAVGRADRRCGLRQGSVREVYGAIHTFTRADLPTREWEWNTSIVAEAHRARLWESRHSVARTSQSGERTRNRRKPKPYHSI